MRDPLRTWFGPLPAVRVEQALAAIGAALVRPEAPDPVPCWLRPGQARSYRQLLPILRKHHGAMLADPLGSGKTWVALAAAARWHHPAQVFAPAGLIEQWQAAARQAGTGIIAWSHERVSRGNMPPDTGGLVIVDESHHYRTPSTHRYQNLARWLRRRRVLMLSATPVINRLPDLAQQLLLGIRDDALLPHGCASIARALAAGEVPVSLGEIIVCNRVAATGRPVRHATGHEIPLTRGEGELLAALDRLSLSSRPPIASLIRGLLVRALASSPAALLAALHRYRSLLLHARDAARSGLRFDRASLRRWVGELPGQLVLWELVAGDASDSDLAIEDVCLLDEIIGAAHAASQAPDQRARRLADVLEDGTRTIVFTTHRATVSYLRQHLPARVSWCTGSAAGEGTFRLPRAHVLRRWAPGARGKGPTTLVTTDVSAEGLNLQSAGRVVHYDLPWTAARVDQREGRVHRLGSPHARVEVVRFRPPAAIEQRLSQLALLERKARLPRLAGVGDAPEARWAWRDAMAERLDAGDAHAGVAWIEGREVAILAAVELRHAGPESTLFLEAWQSATGWSAGPTMLSRLLELAEGSRPAPADTEALDHALTMMTARLRTHFQRALSEAPALDQVKEGLISRVRALAVESVRQRNDAGLARADRALRFIRGGHTAGESLWLRSLLRTDDAAFRSALARMPQVTPPILPGTPRLVALVMFRPTSSRGSALIGDARRE